MHGWREVEIGRSRRGVAIAAHVPAVTRARNATHITTGVSTT